MEGYIPTGLILLDKGVLRRFSGLELQSDYFRNSVIEEQGLGGAGLRTNLPEGFYTFRVQAMEAGTGRQVSNIAETYFSITTPLPPVINLPFNGAEVMMTEPQRVNIQWMPRHYKQAGNTTTYDLKVCKVPDGYEPQEALDACLNPIIDDKANPGTFYPGNTGIGNSIIGAFERGARYAVRVTVHEFDGKSEEVVFANEGRSEVTWFTYGTPRSDGRCVSPPNLTIKELGSGRLQLSWASQGGDARADTKDYKIHYRKAGAANWTTQNIEGITATVSGLSQGTYEFAVQSACSDVFPANIQVFELSDDDDQDDLIPALADPLNTIVTVSGTGIPYVIDSLHSVLDVIKIPCASQISTFESCEADLPVVSPVGTKPLPSLSAGDVLSVYDMTVIVTSAGSGAGGFSGKGLAKLPFLENTMVSVEFEGVQAWAPQEPGISGASTPGGCVYQINGYFRTKALSAEELARQQSGLVATLNNPKDSTAFTGTLSDALKKYDDGVTTTDLSKYTAAVLQGSQTIANALDEVVDEYSDPRLIYISTKLDSLMQVLKTNDSLMKVTGDVIRIENLTGIYTDLFKKLEELKKEGKPDENNPVYAISNVQVINVDDKSARISWQSEGPVSRYVIEYRDTDGGTLQETVTGTQLNLLRLRTGMEYNYRILAYHGDELVASYGEDRFKTIRPTIPRAENLTYIVSGDNSIRISWDKNSLHKKFKLVYTGENGETGYVYPTTNGAEIGNLTPNVKYSYELVAYGEGELQSEAANDQFNVGQVCDIFASGPRRIIAGTEISLTATGCYGYVGGNRDQVRNGNVIWRTTDQRIIGQMHSIVVAPVVTTTYIATCYFDNGQGCSSDYITVTADKKCEGSATVTPESINMGDPVILGAVACLSDVKWMDGYPFGNNIGYGNNVLIKPLTEKTFTVSCKDKSGKECFLQTEKIEIVDKCDNFQITRKQYFTGDFSRNKGGVTYESIGCPTPVVWEYKSNYSKPFLKDGYSIYFPKVSDKKKFELSAKCGECKKSITVEAGYCSAQSDFRVKITNDASGTQKIIQLDGGGYLWEDTNLKANIRVVPIPTDRPVVYRVIPDGKNFGNKDVTCDALEIGINPIEKSKPKSLLDCVPFALNISPRNIRKKGPGGYGAELYFFVPSGCTDGFNSGTVYWDNNEADVRSFIHYDRPEKEITHKATCVIGDLKITKQATLKIQEYNGDPVNQPGDWGFSEAPDWGTGTTGNSSTTAGSTQSGVECSNLLVNYPNSVIKGTPFKLSAVCKAENSFIRIEDRQSPNGNNTITEKEGTASIDFPSSYFDYAGINYDWTKPMEFRIFCMDKTSKKELCHNYVKIPVSCALSVTFDASRVPVVKGCGGQNLVMKYLLNGQATTLDKATHYRAECHTLASFSNIWCTKEGLLPLTNGRVAANESVEQVTVNTGFECIHIQKLTTKSLAKAYLEKLLCQELAKVYGTKQPDGSTRLTLENARALLEALKAVENSPQLMTLGITFPAITDELVTALSDGKCNEVVESLTKDIEGITDLTTSESYDAIKAALDQSLVSSIVKQKQMRKLYLSPDGKLFSLAVSYDRRICPTNIQFKANEKNNGFTWGFLIDGVEYQWSGTEYQDSKGVGLTGQEVIATETLTDNDRIQYLRYQERVGSTFPFIYGYNLSAADFERGNLLETSKTSVNDCEKDEVVCGTNAGLKLSKGALARQFYDAYTSKVVKADEEAHCNLIRLANLVENIGEEYYNDFVAQWQAEANWGNYWFLVPGKVTGPYDSSKLAAAFDALQEYWDAIKYLRHAAPGKSDSKQLVIDLINNNFVSNTTKFKILYKTAFKYLSPERRIEILSYLSQGNIDGRWSISGSFDSEDLIVALLETAPEEQGKDILDGLRDYKLLVPFFKNVDGINFERLVHQLTTFVFASYTRPQPFDLQTAIAHKRYIHFNDNWLGSINTERIDSDGMVHLSSRKLITGSDATYEIATDPYSYVLVTFENDFGVGSSKFSKGESYVLPAIYVYLLFNEDTRQAYKTTAEVAAMVALTALGISEVAAAVEAGSTAGFIAGAVDIGIGLGDIVINTAFRNEVKSVYPDLADDFTKIAMCYGIGRLAGVGLEAVFRKNYIESSIAQFDLRLSDEAKLTSKKLNAQLQKTENFAEFLDDVSDLGVELNRLRTAEWVKGRKLSSEAVNMHTAPSMEYPPYKFGTFVEDVEFGVGEKLYCVEYLHAPSVNPNFKDQPGGWMGSQLFNTEQEAREAFSILPEFKASGQPLVLREYVVKKPIKARKGIAGELYSPSNGHQYTGGGTQIELLEAINKEPVWREYFVEQEEISKGIREYVKKLD
jgi:hypothetical protein